MRSRDDRRGWWVAGALGLLTSCATDIKLPASAAPSECAELPRYTARATADGNASTHVPMTFAQVFVPGQVRPGEPIAVVLEDGSVAPLQVDAKAMHNDGSLRHAVLTARLPRLDREPARFCLTRAAAPSMPAPLTIEQLLHSDFDARVTLTLAGTPYHAAARTLLQSGPVQTWLSGPLVSEWIVRAPVTTADGTAHPHLSVRFNIRAYHGLDRVRVDVIVENAWAYQPGPRNFTYDATVSVGGNPVYTKTQLTHYHHARWRKVFWWGMDPAAHIEHDRAYLIATGAVPNYDPSVTPAAAAIAGLGREWTGSKIEPMGVGLAEPYMPKSGGRRDIGPLPSWAALYLLSQDASAKKVTLGTADLAGSWPIHYRDKNTDLPVSLDTYPSLSTHENLAGQGPHPLPACTACDTPYTPDTAHQPSFAYLPYLVTGDHYYLEELQFWANWNAPFYTDPVYRGYEKSLVKDDEVRGQAWTLRTLGHAAYITPDNHPLKRYFIERVGYNLDWYNANYANNPAANALGYLTNEYAFYPSSIGGVAVPPWQNDFFAWSVGNLVTLGFDQAAPMRAWVARFPVARLTTPDYCRIFGSIYTITVGTSPTQLYRNLGQAYLPTLQNPDNGEPTPANAIGTACASRAMGAALGLEAGEMWGYSDSAEGYPSVMQIALATAVESGIANANNAWHTFMNRSVKPRNYSAEPQFAVLPRIP